MTNKSTITTISVDTVSAAKFDRLAKSNETSKKNLFSLMLNYFEKHGINPVEHESPAQEMRKLIKRCDQVIAFIRKQESNILRPLVSTVSETEIRIKTNLDNLATKENLQSLIEQLNTMVDALNKTSEDLKLENNELKKTEKEQRERTLKALEKIASHLDEKGKAGLMGKFFS